MSDELLTQTYRHLFEQPLYLVRKQQTIQSSCLAEKSAAHMKLVILLIDEDHDIASPQDIDLLNKIADFKEYNLGREAVTVINLAGQSVSFNQLVKKFAPSNIIAFGVTPSDISLQIELLHNQRMKFAGVNLVFTSSLSEISSNEKLKKQFFNAALKPMFSSGS